MYLQLGLRHIADLSGYDHILFIAALSIPYSFADWRRLLWLVTAFTVGHSITLVLATLQLVTIAPTVVEMLIPLTILGAAALAVVEQRRASSRQDGAVPRVRFVLAAVFGLIHGLGFSGYLRSLLGEEERMAIPLLGFNVGLEIGQLAILSTLLVAGTVAVRLSVAQRHWSQFVTVITGGFGLFLFLQRIGIAR